MRFTLGFMLSNSPFASRQRTCWVWSPPMPKFNWNKHQRVISVWWLMEGVNFIVLGVEGQTWFPTCLCR